MSTNRNYLSMDVGEKKKIKNVVVMHEGLYGCRQQGLGTMLDVLLCGTTSAL